LTLASPKLASTNRVVDTLASGSIHFRQARFAVERERQAGARGICERSCWSWARCERQRAQTPVAAAAGRLVARRTKDSAMSRTGSTPATPRARSICSAALR